MLATIDLRMKPDHAPHSVRAVVAGPWAIHHGDGGGLRVTHVASGLALPTGSLSILQARAIVRSLPPEQQVLAECLWCSLFPDAFFTSRTAEAIRGVLARAA